MKSKDIVVSVSALLGAIYVFMYILIYIFLYFFIHILKLKKRFLGFFDSPRINTSCSVDFSFGGVPESLLVKYLSAAFEAVVSMSFAAALDLFFTLVLKSPPPSTSDSIRLPVYSRVGATALTADFPIFFRMGISDLSKL